MRFAPADSADPALPKPDGQNGNPKDVAHVESANLRGPTGFSAPKAVVVAKRNSSWPEMMDTVDYDHDSHSPDSTVRRQQIALQDVPQRVYAVPLARGL